jgi:hypothetical protein
MSKFEKLVIVTIVALMIIVGLSITVLIKSLKSMPEQGGMKGVIGEFWKGKSK